MSKAYDVIESKRPEFFQNIITADMLIRRQLVNIDEFTSSVEAAQECLDALEKAYQEDLWRMKTIMWRLQGREQVDVRLLHDQD